MDAKTISPASQEPAQSTRPKPCCVCKDEKSRRDECMLFSTAKNPEADCKSFVEQYKTCMLGFGYKV